MKVLLDKNICSGHGRCFALAPEVYGSDEMGYCILENAEIPEELAGKARLGAMNCPEGALKIEEDVVPSSVSAARKDD